MRISAQGELKLAHDGDLALDENGDLLIEQGDLVICTGIDSIVSDLKSRLLFFRGEWFLDLDEGLPYFTDILVKRPNLPAIISLISDRILGTPGIKTLRDLKTDFDPSTRKLRIAYSAVSDLGLLLKDVVEVGR